MESIVKEYDRGTLAKRLSKLRGDRSQKEIAKNLDISDAALGTYENGTRVPSAEVIFKLAKYYNVSADYLLGLRKEGSTNPKITDISDYTGLSDKAVENLNKSVNEPYFTTFAQSDSFDYISALLSVSLHESIPYSAASLENNLKKYCESEKFIQETEPRLRELQKKQVNNHNQLMDYSNITNGNMIVFHNKLYEYESKYGLVFFTDEIPEAIDMEKALDALEKKITDIIPTLDPWDFCESINKTAKEYDDTRKALEEGKTIKARAFMEIIETINYLAQR